MNCHGRAPAKGSHFGSRRLRFLDLGAGNGWLSLRLLQRGDAGIAVDINTDEVDGLRALNRIGEANSFELLRVRAVFDRLPLGSRSLDIIVFNASLHYSREPLESLKRVLALLDRKGALYVLDSPIYHHPESGLAVVRQRFLEYRSKFGESFPPDHVGNFLTYDSLEEMRDFYDVSYLSPHYGLRWRLRPVIARLLLRREPASFQIVKMTQREAR